MLHILRITLLFLLVSVISDWLNIPFHVDDFWPDAVLGALLVGIVSWVLGLVIKDRGDEKPVTIRRG